MRPLLTFAALATLAACGGAGVPVTNNPPVNPSPGDALSYGEIADISDEIFQGIRDESATPKADVPLSGRANYAGTVGGELSVGGRDTTIAALMQMDVDFNTDRVGGLIGNVVTRGGSEIDGTLSLRNGTLNRRSNSREVAIFSDVGGTLRSQAGERIDVDANLVGGFAGRNVDYVGATIDGNISVDGQRGTIDARTALER